MAVGGPILAPRTNCLGLPRAISSERASVVQCTFVHVHMLATLTTQSTRCGLDCVTAMGATEHDFERSHEDTISASMSSNSDVIVADPSGGCCRNDNITAMPQPNGTDEFVNPVLFAKPDPIDTELTKISNS